MIRFLLPAVLFALALGVASCALAIGIGAGAYRKGHQDGYAKGHADGFETARAHGRPGMSGVRLVRPPFLVPPIKEGQA